jgi:protein-tyrosine phosphatase
MAVKILMVCLGNICRSPLAEGILKSKLSGSQFIVDSAGTGNWHIGNPPDKRSVAIANKNGIDISKLRGRQFSEKDFDEFDFIYVMDNKNYNDVLELAPNLEAMSKVKLILNEIFPYENVDVPDPYFGFENGFSSVFDMLNEACSVISANLLKKPR